MKMFLCRAVFRMESTPKVQIVCFSSQGEDSKDVAQNFLPHAHRHKGRLVRLQVREL